MNSGKEISDLQNTDAMIKLLAAQRQLYSDAKFWRSLQTWVYVLIPLIITFAQLLLHGITFPFYAYLITEIVFFVAGRCFGMASSKRTLRAAEVQQLFDFRLFGIGNENFIRVSENDLNAASRYGEKHGLSDLENWYGEELSHLSPKSAIRSCQKMNVKWSSKLEQYWLRFITALSLVTILIIVMLTAAANVDPSNLVFIIGCIEFLIEQIWEYLRHLDNLKYLQRFSNDCSLSTTDDLLIFQDQIYESRKSNFNVPDWFYRLFKSKLEKYGASIVEAERFNQNNS